MHFKAGFGMHGVQACDLARARHCVPLAEIATHCEHQRVHLAGGFCQTQGTVLLKSGPTTGSRESFLFVETFGGSGWAFTLGVRPLLRAMLLQQGVTKTRHVADAGRRERGELLINLCG